MANLETQNKAIINPVIDPVCGMEVYPCGIRRIAIYCGRAYWFCSVDCRTAFEMNPQKYLAPKGARRKGWVRRYLERMAKVNKEQFGSASPKCH
jgi:YHS domain-containing protein